MVMGTKGPAEVMGVEERVDENKGKEHRKKGMRQVPPTPSGSLYLAAT